MESNSNLAWFCCCLFNIMLSLFCLSLSRQALEHVFEHTYNHTYSHIFSLTHTLIRTSSHTCVHTHIHAYIYSFLKNAYIQFCDTDFVSILVQLKLELSKNFKRVLIKTLRVLFTFTRRKTVRVTHSGFHRPPK